jgi:hypothetical protein
MLALQRSIGNRRTATLVANRRQIARKFGFELELGMPLTARGSRPATSTARSSIRCTTRKIASPSRPAKSSRSRSITPRA